MIHIIWTGKGFLVAVFVFGSSLIANLITNAMTGSASYWEAHKWPFADSLFVSGALCWSVGRQLHSKPARVLLDPNTGKQVVLRNSHTFFFIPVMWWGPILGLGGLIILAVEALK
jgi:hypothetical protein